MRAERPQPGRDLTDTERKILDRAVSGQPLAKMEVKILAVMWERLGYIVPPAAGCHCSAHQRAMFVDIILPEMEKHVMADDWALEKIRLDNDQTTTG